MRRKGVTVEVPGVGDVAPVARESRRERRPQAAGEVTERTAFAWNNEDVAPKGRLRHVDLRREGECRTVGLPGGSRYVEVARGDLDRAVAGTKAANEEMLPAPVQQAFLIALERQTA